MRASEFIAEDLSRRGFLRGLGAAGATVATGGALAKKKPEEVSILTKKGDTIYSLAREYNTTPQEIVRLNKYQHLTLQSKLPIDHPMQVPYTFPEKTKAPAKHIEPVAQKHTEPTKASELPKPNTPSKTSGNALEEPGFIQKLVQVSQELGISAKALFGIIKHESHFRHHVPNPHTGAMGLIQFTPETAKWLGTSTQQLAKMSGTEQLDYVYEFLKRGRVKPGMDIGDLYMSIFLPAKVGAPLDTVLGKEGGGRLPGTDKNMNLIWKQNPSFSDNLRKPYFTVADVKKRLSTFMPD